MFIPNFLLSSYALCNGAAFFLAVLALTDGNERNLETYVRENIRMLLTLPLWSKTFEGLMYKCDLRTVIMEPGTLLSPHLVFYLNHTHTRYSLVPCYSIIICILSDGSKVKPKWGGADICPRRVDYYVHHLPFLLIFEVSPPPRIYFVMTGTERSAVLQLG